MASSKAVSVLLILIAVAGTAHAQFMQPMQPLPGMPAMAPMQPLPPMKIPEGAQVATASAVANGPGTATSFSSNNNGVTSGFTQSSGKHFQAVMGHKVPEVLHKAGLVRHLLPADIPASLCSCLLNVEPCLLAKPHLNQGWALLLVVSASPVPSIHTKGTQSIKQSS
eukprot:GHUV01040965.1.p1 GENE.GHUV01040965.1~~GHUV01040965.1.p1  ORF type:complete len:167 (-),score=28.97 GHUV01040965.1:438-938(-)